MIAAAALATAIAGLTLERERRADLRRLVDDAARIGIDAGAATALGRALARETEPGARRLALARAALAAAATPAPTTPTASAASELVSRRLDAAAGWGREALARLPASWEAAEIVGLSVALGRLARRDADLLADRDAWRPALVAAAARFPASPRPPRALAGALLEIWPGLNAAERASAAPVVRRAFEEPLFLERALPRWLELAGSIEGAVELLPDRSHTWRRLFVAAVERGELAAAASLRERERRALADELEGELSSHSSQLRDELRPAGGLDPLIAAAPRDAAFVPWLERALAARAPGPASPQLAAAAERWLDWARPLCLSAGCPLSPSAFDRLGGVAGSVLAPSEAAFAALAAGDTARAEQLARRSEALWSAEWAPYSLLAAERRRAAGDGAGARAALDRVHRSARTGLAYRRLAAELAEPAEPQESDRSLATSAERWESSEWETERDDPRLALRSALAARALVVRFARPAPRPSLIVAEWNGRAAPALELAAGATSLRLELPVAPSPSLLRLVAVAGELPPVGLTTLEAPR